MRNLILILITIFAIKAHGQCGVGLPKASYHSTMFVTANGDTFNKKNGLGYYEGLHLYTDNASQVYGPGHSFILGSYNHGIPIGDWVDHCSNGSFSIGQYVAGWECSPNENGVYTSRKQGIYEKVGVWKYFDKDSNLIKTMQYIRERKTDETYLMDSSGRFILIRYKYNDMRNLSSPFKKMVTKEFTKDGKILSHDFENFWKNISIQFYENGQVKQKFKCRKILGIKINRSINKSYSLDGNQTDKKIGKCWTKFYHPDFW